MTNFLEAITKTVFSLTDDDPTPPLHVGEVMNCWTLLALFREGEVYYQSGLNTTTDPELRHAFQEGLKASQKESEELKNFLIKEGIPLPPMEESKPESDPDSIPLGVKATDNELANTISIKIALSIAFIGQALSVTIRNDVGVMLLKFQSELLAYGSNLKSLMKKRGWLKVPPYYYPPGSAKE